MKIYRNRKLVPDTTLLAFLKDFEENTTPIEGGGLSYKHLPENEIYEILPDAFHIRPKISRSEGIALFRWALHQCRIAGTMTADFLMNCASDRYREQMSVPNKPYSLWTKFRIKTPEHQKEIRFRWNDVNFRISSSLPKRLFLENFFHNGTGRIEPTEPRGFGYAILNCRDRHDERAVDRMMDTLQLILGLMNMYEARSRRTMISGRHWTDGKFLNGPYQFVFRRDKFIGDEMLWYEPSYRLEVWKRDAPTATHVNKAVPMTRKALKKLVDHPLKENLTTAIRIFQDGFCSEDSSYRLLRYWSALEQIYVSSDNRNGSNEQVVSGATFAEREPAITRWKLEHIMRLRNEYVHEAATGNDLHDMCEFLRELVFRHINHWIFKGTYLRSHDDLLKFVKLPRGKNDLIAARELIDRRLEYFAS